MSNLPFIHSLLVGHNARRNTRWAGGGAPAETRSDSKITLNNNQHGTEKIQIQMAII